MRRKRAGGVLGPVIKVEMLQEKDVGEYERIRSELVNVLERLGEYEPAVDNIHIDEIARTAIYAPGLRQSMILFDKVLEFVDFHCQRVFSWNIVLGRKFASRTDRRSLLYHAGETVPH